MQVAVEHMPVSSLVIGKLVCLQGVTIRNYEKL